MLKIITVVAVSALTLAATFTPRPAEARDGAIAAGVIGGLAVGAIVGSQVNRNDGYYRSGYYGGGYRECRIERRDWEDRYGRLHVRNVRVCD
jgi:uncharacterized membrane protein